MRIPLLALAVALSACNPNPPPAQPSGGKVASPAGPNPSPIRHIVVVIQENRSFNNLFMGFPGANTSTTGLNSSGQQVTLQSEGLTAPYDINHGHQDWLLEYAAGQNNGWDRALSNCPGLNPDCPSKAIRAFAYVPQAQVQPYWDMATQYALADEMFQTNEGPSFPAHQYLISGTSTISNGSNLRAAENPGQNGIGGCDSPAGTKVTLIDENGSEAKSTFPCFQRKSIFGEANTAGVTWHYYQAIAGSGLWNGPDAIEKLCPTAPCNSNPGYAANVIVPSAQFLTDIANGTLSQITYITPTAAASDHALLTDGTGPAWVASVVNAIGTSPFWNSTAIFITWDDWGGWYDHVTPHVRDSYELSFRVPLIVVSPYAKVGYVSHVPHEFGSILKFEELTFGLPSMGTTDVTADNLSDIFNYAQAPTPFVPISGGNPSYFKKHSHDAREIDD